MFSYCLNLSCLNRRYSIFDKLEAASKVGFCSVEISFEDINGEEKPVKKAIDDLGLHVPTVFKLHGWFEVDGGFFGVPDRYDAIMDECKRRMESAIEIGAEWVIAVPSYSHRGFFVETERGVEHFADLMDVGRQIGILPTLEFMGQTSQINTIGKCIDFLNDLSDPEATMIIDSYHVWRGDSDVNDVIKIPRDQISLLHIADADPLITKKIHRDMDRVMPGDGVIDNVEFLNLAKKIGYEGRVSLGVYKFRDTDESPLRTAAGGYAKMERIFNAI